MKSAKRLYFATALLIVLLVGMLLIVNIPSVAMAAETETQGKAQTDWKAYWENEIAPNVVLAITAIAAIYTAIMPILTKLKKASGKFEVATTDVKAATTRTQENETKIASLEERLEKIEKATANTEEITRIGFCNLNELVSKGYANEIAKVGGENDGSEIEE